MDQYGSKRSKWIFFFFFQDLLSWTVFQWRLKSLLRRVRYRQPACGQTKGKGSFPHSARWWKSNALWFLYDRPQWQTNATKSGGTEEPAGFKKKNSPEKKKIQLILFPSIFQSFSLTSTKIVIISIANRVIPFPYNHLDTRNIAQLYVPSRILKQFKKKSSCWFNFDLRSKWDATEKP